MEPPAPASPDDTFVPLVGAQPEDDDCAPCDEAFDDDARLDLASLIEMTSDDDAELDAAVEDEDDEDADLTADEMADLEALFARPLVAASSSGDQLADVAAGLAGLPYSWGGISPTTGFDCSGLVYYVHRQFGVTLNRDAAAQFANGRSVSRGELQPGDIVFFADTYARGISHDGIYLGGGRFVHAVQPGSGVRVTSMGDGYWSPKFVGARRVFD